MPAQHLGIGRLSLIVDLVVLVLTIALVLGLARIPRRYQRLARRGIPGWPGLLRRSGLIAVLHFVWPLLLLYVALTIPTWSVLVMFEPDLGYWLELVAAIVFLKGWIELALIWRVFTHIHRRQILQPV